MSCYITLIAFILVAVVLYMWLNEESFSVISGLGPGPNYESGANMLRGDLPIAPVQQSWFNTKYGPSNLTPGYF